MPAQLILEVAFLCWNEMLPTATALLIFNITVLNEQQIPDQNKRQLQWAMTVHKSNIGPALEVYLGYPKRFSTLTRRKSDGLY